MFAVKLISLSLILLLALPPLAHGAENEVIASIKPLHSLVKNIMGDTGEPGLLVDGSRSPHGFQLKPSQRKQIEHAKVIFYVGDGLEGFLVDALQSAPPSLRAVALEKESGMRLLSQRNAAVWEPGRHDAFIFSKTSPFPDPHLWMNVENAKIIVNAIVRELTALHPENTAIYEANAALTVKRLNALDQALREESQGIQNIAYIVYHDAFQYFEAAYGLKSVGALTAEPEQAPGAQRLSRVSKKIEEAKVTCVFTEPQFNPRLVQALGDKAVLRTYVLDEHGAEIDKGAELYFTLMRRLMEGFRRCGLSEASKE